MKLKVGDKVTPKYRGRIVAEYDVRGIAKLAKPAVYHDDAMGGEVSFNPTIILLESTADGHRELWFPYWIATPRTKGKERYGQFAPMYGEDCFLPLLKEAIRQRFFSADFLKKLANELNQALSR
jgi:hypothetical protein